jgi:hypothetical protein
MQQKQTTIRGRGTADNPANRFAALFYARSEEWTAPEDPAPTTRFLQGTTRSILAQNDSPDVGFETSVNPHRGCEHG